MGSAGKRPCLVGGIARGGGNHRYCFGKRVSVGKKEDRRKGAASVERQWDAL